MSKQYLSDMVKSIASGDLEAAKAHFSKYSTEKSQEILARQDTPPADDNQTPPADDTQTPPVDGGQTPPAGDNGNKE